ncbi:DUF1232 domain-containing protein [Arthrobacter tumbae]|uniref:YkvA family protein n=1 Tax=Arthrobacter tumbae TaxID=163874 RepID=UPI00195A678E|nr:DUF1232 domain-containing protein [Arthrobacter tumbae]MBM7781124.1 uncharacterized membrane protein YkvA (DUF1232 family) [Arthrobacter tumbae]
MSWEPVVAILAGLLVVYVVALVLLYLYARRNPETVSMRSALRLLPDLLRLLRSLLRDREVPRSVRVLIVVLLAYLVLPIDLVPDFIPVLGYADDLIIVAVVLRAVIRRTGPELLARLWTGDDDGLHVVLRLAGYAERP